MYMPGAHSWPEEAIGSPGAGEVVVSYHVVLALWKNNQSWLLIAEPPFQTSDSQPVDRNPLWDQTTLSVSD